jgi:hypothetical protein
MSGIDLNEKEGTFHIAIRAKDRKLVKLVHYNFLTGDRAEKLFLLMRRS